MKVVMKNISNFKKYEIKKSKTIIGGSGGPTDPIVKPVKTDKPDKPKETSIN